MHDYTFLKKNLILNATTVQLSLYLDQLKEENYKLLDKLVKAICKLFCFIRDTTSVNLFVFKIKCLHKTFKIDCLETSCY